MKSLIFTIAVCCLMAVPSIGGQLFVEARMKTIIFEEINFRSIQFTDAVDYLREKSKELDPQKKGINIIVKSHNGPNPKLTMKMGKNSLYTILKELSNSAHYRWRFIGNNLILEPIPPAKK